MGQSARAVVIVLGLLLTACAAAEDRVDPADLQLRDLLGLAPRVAAEWDGGQRAAARAVLAGALAAPAEDEGATVALAAGGELRAIVGELARIDRQRADAGEDALPLVRIDVERAAGARTGASATAGGIVVAGLSAAELIAAGDAASELDVLSALAHDAGDVAGDPYVEPVARLAVIAARVGAPGERSRLLVNPVLLAALEPEGELIPLATSTASAGGSPAGAGSPTAREAGGERSAGPAGAMTAAGAGNPYSFYGSVGECAAAQRRRCEACLAGGDCTPVTDTSDGRAECTTLMENGARGTFLLCANLSLSITSVGSCVRGDAPTCPFTTDAARSLATLEENARFVDDATCGGPLDACLADIYGAPSGPFPGTDGGPEGEPRDLNVSCGNSCDDNNANCSPSCGGCEGSGPSCDNSLSCAGACSSSNEQSGCGGNCEACGDGGSGGGGCGGDCSSGDSGGGGGCGDCSSNDSGGSCGSSDGSSGCSGCGSSDGGGCGSSDSGGCGSCNNDSGGSSNCGSGGNSNGSCTVARRGPPAGLGMAIAALWALLPLPAAGLLRRSKRRRRRDEDREDDDRTDGGAS